MTPRIEILTEARRLIADGEWGQGTNASRPGSRCAVQAIGDAANGSEFWNCCGLFKEAIGGSFPTEWNDAVGRTKAEVLAAFDKAIALAAHTP